MQQVDKGAAVSANGARTALHQDLFAGLSGRSRLPSGNCVPGTPLVLAIHGGTYTSAYFDIPGYSLFERAGALGIPIIGIDRPGYGSSDMMDLTQATIHNQAHWLVTTLNEAWRQYGTGTRGIVLVGHSIGGAIAASIAAYNTALPLLGLAISGVCLRTPPHYREAWDSLPDTELVGMPSVLKDNVMFGPVGSFDSAMPAASHAADALAVRAELIDIVNDWPGHAHAVLERITIPVHYRQAEFDKLWIVDQGQVDEFAGALCHSPRVDAAMVKGTGHCIDFHRMGAALQIQQLGFALQCASESETKV